jgi:uncharacterized protein YcfL
MKKLFSILFLASFVLVAFSQERTVLLNNGKPLNLSTSKTVVYNGGTSDYLLPTTRDTIDYTLTIDGTADRQLQVYANVTYSTIVGTDTTVLMSLLVKQCYSEDYSSLTTATSAVISSTNIQKAITSCGVTNIYASSTIPNSLLYYRYLKLRLILAGNDSVGTGVKVKRVEINFF